MNVKQEKYISFRDFFKEDIFNEQETTKAGDVASVLPADYTPVLEQHGPAPENETRDYWKSLRHFYQTGENIETRETKRVYPPLLHSYLNEQQIPAEYPFYIPDDNTLNSAPLEEMLINTFNAVFHDNKAEVLKNNLVRLVQYFTNLVSEAGNYCDFSEISAKCFEKLAKSDVRGDEGKRFREQLVCLQNALPKSGKLIPFSENVQLVFMMQLLGGQLLQNRIEYCAKIKKLCSRLKKLSKVNDKKDGSSGVSDARRKNYDFASQMILFDKLSGILPYSVGQPLSEKRIKRIKATIRQLEKAEDILLSRHGSVFITKKLANELQIKKLMPHARLQIIEKDNVFKSGITFFQKEITPFTNLIKAARIADLELQGEFDEELHPGYFSHFNRQQLEVQELAMFPPIILIEKTQKLLKRGLADFSQLLASNLPLRILSFQDISETIAGEGDSALFSFRRELAAISISHRGAFTFQGAADEPALLYKAFYDGLTCGSTSLWHILLPPNPGSFLHLRAAAESRAFPGIIYNGDTGERFGGRFYIEHNSQTEKPWPQYTLKVKSSGETSELSLAFTYADYLILNSEISNEINPVPSEFWTADLIPLAEYLNGKKEELAGKVPFIWVEDENNRLHRAAVPFHWVISCRERLDFWQFIQELGGVNSYHAEHAIAKAKVEWDTEREKETAASAQEHAGEIEKARNEVTGKAMDRLVSVLLDLDNIVSIPASKPPVPHTEVTEKRDKRKEEKEEEEVIDISSEPWLETSMCTSCNECTDKYPNIFKYNGEKQAYVNDATKGTYAQLVMAAEECPAKCIHPGQPQNKNEPGLEGLIKRAEKFN